jgi:hypothetical protein
MFSVRRLRFSAVWGLALLLAAGACAPGAAKGAARVPAGTSELAVRAAQADALLRLADTVLACHLVAGQPVSEALGRGSEGAIALRVFLRSARISGEPRAYSDGASEVGIEVPLDGVIAEVGRLCNRDTSDPHVLEDLRAKAVDGFLRETGAARAPEDVPEPILKAALAAPREALPELYPLGWESVAPSGRVQAARDARIRAYKAMADCLGGLRLVPTATLAEQLRPYPVAAARLDAFIRSLPVQGRPRFMPDRIAEIEVVAPAAKLIEVLKEIRKLLPPDQQWPVEQLDQFSIRFKDEQLTVTGRGMPAAEFVWAKRPGLAEIGPVPEWAGHVLEARATAGVSKDVKDAQQARLLAARSAQAKAAERLREQLQAVKMDDGQTVGQRAAKDKVFAQDVATFMESARISLSRAADGGQWEVGLQLPLLRLYEFSVRKD